MGEQADHHAEARERERERDREPAAQAAPENDGLVSEIDFFTAALAGYQAPAAAQGLPSTPQPVIRVRSEANRPQPRLDRMTGHGMTTVVGRVRPDPLLDYKLVVLSHNTIRGAAGGAIYNGELLVKLGYVK